MTDTERDLGRRWFEEVWNQQRREAVAEILAPDAVLHEGGVDSVGPEGFYPFLDRMNAALSDIHVEVLETIAEGDRLCVRWLCSARHTGPGLGFPAAGKPVRVTGISILRVAGGKLAEGWQNWDMLGMMTQARGEVRAATYVG
jgi:steroid delta-isomerase-like uncharacterized protein